MRAVAIIVTALASLGAAACSGGASDGTGGASGSAGQPSGTAGSSTAGSSGAAAVAGSSAGGAGGGGGSAGAAAGAGGSGGANATGCAIPANGMEPPSMLSQTGCVDMKDPTKAAPGFIPYTVRSPLWSDGADKHRFIRVPSGAKIHVLDCSTQVDACAMDSVNGDDGHWQVPIGTVLVKNFSLQGKIIETRLVMRRSETKWLFYGYEWNDAATEATLLPDDNLGKERQVGTQTWHYPGRGQCPQCHTPGGGFSLGPSTPQMNVDYMYPEGAMNQVAKFTQLGLFDAPPKTMTGYPAPTDTAVPLEERALSYIQVNCAICHRPSGEYSGMDMRWTTSHEMTAIEGMRLCDQAERDMGKNGLPKYRVVPGEPMKSGMSFRVHALDELRMPKIGSAVVDPLGAQLIDDWIAAMPSNACGQQPP